MFSSLVDIPVCVSQLISFCFILLLSILLSLLCIRWSMFCLFSYHCYAFSGVFLSTLCFSLAVLAAVINVGCWQRMEEKGAALEMGIKQTFQSWGIFVANNPLKVILISLIVTGGLCAGVVFFKGQRGRGGGGEGEGGRLVHCRWISFRVGALCLFVISIAPATAGMLRLEWRAAELGVRCLHEGL